MGRVKEEMIRQQELEHMYEWIEENYGDDAGEEGSATWEEAVEAYRAYCERQWRQEEEWAREAQQELEWYIHTQSQIYVFNTEMQSVENLLNVELHEETQFSLFVMLHGHVVASVEAYLASTFIHKVTNSEMLIRKLVESDPVFSKRKFTLNEIFNKKEELKLIVAAHLKDLIFHKLEKVKPMYKAVLDCDFGDITWLHEAVNIRHHCVHRAGRTKEGNQINLTVDSIRELAKMATILVHDIEQKVSEITEIEETENCLF